MHCAYGPPLARWTRLLFTKATRNISWQSTSGITSCVRSTWDRRKGLYGICSLRPSATMHFIQLKGNDVVLGVGEAHWFKLPACFGRSASPFVGNAVFLFLVLQLRPAGDDVVLERVRYNGFENKLLLPLAGATVARRKGQCVRHERLDNMWALRLQYCGDGACTVARGPGCLSYTTTSRSFRLSFLLNAAAFAPGLPGIFLARTFHLHVVL